MTYDSRVRIGHRAPDFQCDAVIRGSIEEVTLATFIDPTATTPPWLILLFIPAAFSFVCPTEVLAFQNCLEEFRDRNCNVVFASVDTKHSLWHWQNVPRQYGGLGSIDISLLSDANHRMSRDYGVLIEEEGVCLRGMFILDGNGIVQQITLNNLTVGRSVLEALRLLEAFQAVAKHGVLCPIDWRPSETTSDITKIISNTLTESYDDRLANLQKEFGGEVVVTDLDAKHRREDEENMRQSMSPPADRRNSDPSRPSLDEDDSNDRATVANPRYDVSLTHTDQPPDAALADCLPRSPPRPRLVVHSSSAPAISQVHTRAGHASARSDFYPNDGVTPRPHSLAHNFTHTDDKTTYRPHSPAHSHHMHNTFLSRSGSHVVLEFADPRSPPTASPHAHPSAILPGPAYPANPLHHTHARYDTPAMPSIVARPALARSASHAATKTTPVPGQTRLQATFEAIKKMSAELSSPRTEFGSKQSSLGGVAGSGSASTSREGVGVRSPGYFDVAVEDDGIEA